VGGCAIDDRSPSTLVASGGADNASPAAAPSTSVSAELPASPALAGGSGPGAMEGAMGGADADDLPAQLDAAVAPPAADPPCHGCVELVVPVTAAQQSAQFEFQYAAPGLDFSSGSLQWRVQVLPVDTNPNFFITTDVQNGESNAYAGLFENYRVLSGANFPAGEWVELAVDVSGFPPPLMTGFDYRRVEWVSLTLGTTSEFVGTGTVRVLVDSFAINGVTYGNRSDFSTGADGLDLDAFQVPEGTLEPIFHP
jgi:hypothetical protein